MDPSYQEPLEPRVSLPDNRALKYSSEYHYWRLTLTMEKSVSAADANRNFSQLLRGVRQGRSFVVTSHGEPVAKISPVDEPGRVAIGARDALLDRLRRQAVMKIGRWSRDELYEDAR
jgi:prevent-host-death family protein